MLAAYKKNTNIGVGVGMVIQIIGKAIANPFVILVGAAVFVWGCGQYAKGKGHSAWYGALGLLSILGLIVLVLMPDRHK